MIILCRYQQQCLLCTELTSNITFSSHYNLSLPSQLHQKHPDGIHYTVTILTREHYRASDLILVIAQGPEDRRQTGDQWDGCAHLPGGDAAGRDAGLQPTGHVEPGPHPHHQRAGWSLQVRRWLLQVIRGDRWANALRKCRKRLQKVDHICSWDCRSHFCFGIHSKITFL